MELSEEADTSTLIYGAPNWPSGAPDRANYRMLGLADLARTVIDGIAAAGVRQSGIARA